MSNVRKLTAAGLLAASAALASAAAFATAAAPSPQADDVTEIRDYLSGNGLLNRGMYDLAAEEYRKFLAQHPDHVKAPVARYGLGVALFRLKDYENAARELTPLADARNFEFAAETNLLLGQAHMQRDAWDDAAAAFTRVIEHHAEHPSADDAGALLVESLYRDEAHERLAEAAEAFLDTWPQSDRRERVELFDGLAAVARDNHAHAADRFAGMLERFPDGEFAPRVTLLLGRANQTLERNEEAVEQYRRVVEQGHDAYVPEALYGMGVILRRDGDNAAAREALDQLLEEHADHALATPGRYERGRALFDLNDFTAAHQDFSALHSTEADLADDAAYWLAKTELRQENYASAANRLGEAIATYPDSPLAAEMQYDRAIAQLRAEQPSEAIDTLRAFRRAHPQHPMAAEALYLMASSAHALGDYAGSAEFCEQFASEHAGHAHAAGIAYLHAENAFLAGDMNAATQRFSAFIEEHRDHEQARNATYRLGTALYRLDRHDEAQQYLASVAGGEETDAAYISALFAMGNIAFDREAWADAERLMGEYLSFGDDVPNADDALIRRGLAQHRQEKHEEAIESYDRLIGDFEESVHLAQARFEKGQALVALDRDDDAVSAFEALLEMGDDATRFAPHAMNHLGAIAMHQERYEDAAGWYQRVAQANLDAATRGEALFQRGQALMAIERYDEAHGAFVGLIEAAPQHERAPLARANAALALARQDRHGEALAAIDAIDAQSMAKLSEGLRSSLAYERAWAHRESGDDDAALAAYRAMLEDDASSDLDLYARIELAELESQARNFEATESLLSEIDFAGDSLPATLHERGLYRLGVAQFELDQFEQAAGTFDVLIDRHADSEYLASALLLAGESLYQEGDYQEATDRLTVVAEEHQDAEGHAAALLRLGECQAQLQEFDVSRATFAQHREQYPESPVWFQAQFGIGWALENQGDFDEAIEAYRLVADQHQGATAARAQFQIGECLFAKKEYEPAVRELLKVDILYAYPEWSAAAIFEAGRCFEALAQTGQARQQYQQVKQRYPGTRWAEMSDERLTALAQSDLPGRGGGG